MIAGDHFHANARLQAVANRRNRFRTRRIHHSGNTEEDNPLLQILMGQLALPAGRRFPRRRDHAQPFPRVLFNFCFPVRLIQRLQAVLGLLLLAKPEQHIRGTGD